AREIVSSAATTSFLQGGQRAHLAGMVAVILGAAVVFIVFPRRARSGGRSRTTSSIWLNHGMPKVGIEPTRPFGHRIMSLAKSPERPNLNETNGCVPGESEGVAAKTLRPFSADLVAL